ncbi:MAG: sulfite exporter TauE/SafE family protein [Gammaproteobacteria bacterium]|nr:sulfite exporter TauE/SafE family protein [Gammaproteobacteria bacterium]
MFSPILVVIVIFVGILIGGVGIGGVLLVPSLKYFGSVSMHIAIPACMLGYIVTGAIGALIYAKHGTINWALAIKICFGALPGAYLGSVILPYVSASILELAIGILILASGLDSLIRRNKEFGSRLPSSKTELISIGFITGIGSALTGTGGPLLLIPILLWRKTPVLIAIGLSQAVQVPISLTATAGNLLHSAVDFKLGLILGLILGTGAILGAKLAHYLPVDLLKKFVAMLLVGVGLVILFDTSLRG